MQVSKYYRINEIPDPTINSLRLRYGKVRQEISGAWMSLLRIISELPADSCIARIIFYYVPDSTVGIQSRLRLYIAVTPKNVSLSFLDTLLVRGGVGEFYKLQEVEGSDIDVSWDEFDAIGEILKRFEPVTTYLTTRQNARVNPEKPYTQPMQFEPDGDNDFMLYDKLLSGFKGRVYAEVMVRPAAVHEETNVILREIQSLITINERKFGEAKTEEDLMMKREFEKDLIADSVYRECQNYAESMRVPQLRFSIRFCGTYSDEVKLAMAVFGECSFRNGSYRMIHAERSAPEFAKHLENFKKCKINSSWQHFPLIKSDFFRHTRLAGVEELSGVFRLPFAANLSPLTIRKSTDPVYERIANSRAGVLIGDDMECGGDANTASEDKLWNLFDTEDTSVIRHRLKAELIKKHIFICGVPGSGKTTAIFNILVQLYRMGIPFLIIEPAKTEYRILKLLRNNTNPELAALGDNLKVFTPGNESVSPFRYNPFAFPEGISLDEHLNNLLNCFQAAMTLPADSPLPGILAISMEEVYEGYEEKGFPYMEDLVKKIEEVTDRQNYERSIIGNIKTAIQVRISPLVSRKRAVGKIFSRVEKPVEVSSLFGSPMLIELDSLNSEQAGLLTLFILTSLREHIKATRQSGSPLSHVIVVEEAHNIVANISPNAPPDDPGKRAANYITRMLAELRALGEGIIIADQLPSTVAAEVIKNTGTKIAHRLTSMDDREQIGATMLLGAEEIEDFARLNVGEAFYYSEELYGPRRVRCVNSNAVLGFYDTHTKKSVQPPDNRMLKALIDAEGFVEGYQKLKVLIMQICDSTVWISEQISRLYTDVKTRLQSPEKTEIPLSGEETGHWMMQLKGLLNRQKEVAEEYRRSEAIIIELKNTAQVNNYYSRTDIDLLAKAEGGMELIKESLLEKIPRRMKKLFTMIKEQNQQQKGTTNGKI